MFDYDSQLLEVVQVAKPQSIPDVTKVLEAIDALCVDGDGLKWFNWLYLRVTKAVGGATFTDPAWLASLDVHFAGFYFEALAAWLKQEGLSECWRVLFERRDHGRIARIQFALAGINAHINHDLCAAVVATCAATGSTPDHGGVHYRDYMAVNSTLDAQVEEAKRTLHVRLLGEVLPPVSHLEDTLAAWSVTAAREKAWINAEHLWRLRSLPVLRDSYLDTLDGFTSVIGQTLLVPVP